MPKIKICGITNYADAKAALDLGVDALGFNFYPGSPRFVDPETAKGIIEQLPRTIWLTGVFVNAEPAEVLSIAQNARLDTLQFHGDEDAAYLQKFRGWRVLKALRFAGTFSLQEVMSYAAAADYLLFDKYDPAHFGGTGGEIQAELLAKLGDYELLARAFIAGGLTPENVAARVAAYRPFGVDVASGVESTPGKKDPAKLRAFVAAVRGC